MSYISWSRVAYIFFVLAVLAALLKLGSLGLSDSSPLRQAAAKTPDAQRTEIQENQNTEAVKSVTSSSEGDSSSSSVDTVEVRNVETRNGGSSAAPQKTDDGTTIFYRPAKKQEAKRDKASRKKSSGDKSRKGKPSREDSSGLGSPQGGSGQSGISSPFQSTNTEPVCGNLRNVSKGSKAVFPLSDQFFNSYDDTWGAARPQGGHAGTDLMTPMNTPEYAITDATVVPVSGANGNGWNTLGGYTLMLRADYSIGPVQEGDLFYYAHMDREASLKIGSRVEAGQLIGYAGDTGQGSEITRGLFPPHLHLGWYDTTGARASVESGAMNPFPLLEWIKTNGGAVSGGSDAKYCTAPQTGPPIPSTGEQSWPTQDNPTDRPDIDTGGTDAAPSPVVKRATNESKKSPRPDKPLKNERIRSEKPDVTPPNLKDKPGLGSQGKSPRLKVPRAGEIVDKVRDMIDDAFNNDKRDKPDKNNVKKAKKDNDRTKKPTSNRKDKSAKNESNCETSGKLIDAKKRAKANKTIEECADSPERQSDSGSKKPNNDGANDNTDGKATDAKPEYEDEKSGDTSDEENTEGEQTTVNPPGDEDAVTENTSPDDADLPPDQPAAEDEATVEEKPVVEEAAPVVEEPVVEEPVVEEEAPAAETTQE
ncbi:MAG: peptidoglycan DD-metalloendopeptidase family protein [Rubrobacteraceae bacterium]